MSIPIGRIAIDRAFRSLDTDGHLNLGFFGGEPLLESERILDWMSYARQRADGSAKTVRFNVTTNGTITNDIAWRVMMADELDLAVSFDGTPEIHDRHRRDSQGRGSATQVRTTLRQLIASQRDFHVNVVVRPDNLRELPEGLIYLHDLGVRCVELSLDLWTTWSAVDGCRLETLIHSAAELWAQWLPDFSLNWFDSKVGELACLPMTEETTRCGFGDGEIAVAPSGRLYPCERLIGEDRLDHPLRLSGYVFEGRDFLAYSPSPFERCATCASCALIGACDSVCRCSNFVRTGDVNRPDGLLCILNKVAAREVSNALTRTTISRTVSNQNERPCYVG
jgi:uncharacterized protein